MRILAVFLASICIAGGSIAASAPSSIKDAIIRINLLNAAFFYTTSELALLRPDGTFQDLSYTTSFGGAPNTLTPTNGTYVYTPSATQGDQGSISWTVNNASHTTTLTFQTATTGIVDNFVLETFSVYPSTASTGAANVSNNCWITTAHPSISGFVIEGSAARWVLIRGDGPSLAQFATPSPISTPQLTLYSEIDPIQHPGVWSSDPNLIAGFQSVFALVGAFQFQTSSADSAGLYLLSPGAYTVVGVTPNSEGTLLTEVFILPYGS